MVKPPRKQPAPLNHPQQASLLPLEVVARLQAAAATCRDASRAIDAIVLEVENREPGRYWQPAQIEFLRKPITTRFDSIKRAPKESVPDEPAPVHFDEASLEETRRLIQRSVL